MIDIIIFSGLGVVILTGWLWPRSVLFLPLLLIPAYILRTTVFGVPTNLFELSLGVCLIFFFLREGRSGASRMISAYQPIMLPLAILAVGLAIGMATAPDPIRALGIVKGWFVVPLLLYGLIMAIIHHRKQSDLVVWPLLLSTLPLSLTALSQVLFGWGLTPDGRAPAWFGSPNYLALYAVPIIALSLGLLSSSRRSLQWLVGLIAFLGLVATITAFSYGGWLAIFVAGLTFVFTTWPRRGWLGLLVAVVTAIVAGLSQLTNPRFVQMLDLANRSSASVRLQVWATDWLMIKEHWLTGIGLGQYAGRYLEFASTIFFPPIETGMLHGHNLFLQFAIEMGIVGWIFLVALGIVLVNRFKNWQGPWRPAVAAALAAILSHGLVDTAYWKNDLSAIFWVVVALILVGYNQRDEQISHRH